MNPNGTEFWNGDGGRRWVANIEITETMLEPLEKQLLAAAAAGPGESVIDIGCGGGRTSLALAAQVGDTGRVTGIDISEPILEVASQRAAGRPNIAFRRGDAARMVLPEAAFDLLVSRFGVMFFEQPVSAFRHLRSCLRQSGRAAFLCWQSMDRNPWMAEPAAMAQEVLPPAAAADPNAPGPFAFADPLRIKAILTEAGFTSISVNDAPSSIGWADVDTALGYLLEMGMVGRLLQDQPAAVAERVREGIRGVLQTHRAGDGRVVMQAAAWLVCARI